MMTSVRLGISDFNSESTDSTSFVGELSVSLFVAETRVVQIHLSVEFLDIPHLPS